MNIEKIKVKYEGRKTISETKEKQLFNINAFSNLDKNNLIFNEKEKQVLFYTTSYGEKIFLQYPGKESARIDNKARPWDFRPKLFLANNTQIKDLSFPDIWDDLTNLHQSDNKILSFLATIFFRMAYMIDFQKKKIALSCKIIDISEHLEIATENLDFEYYAPCFDSEVLEEIQNKIGLIREISLEAYLLYNDLLLQNEDCKYYYRATIEKGEKWKYKTGRINTILSHISVIEYLQNKITFSEIMMRFQRGMGVAPLPLTRLPNITRELVELT